MQDVRLSSLKDHLVIGLESLREAVLSLVSKANNESSNHKIQRRKHTVG